MEVSGQLHAPAAYPRERAPRTHWIGGWMGPRAVLDAVVKKIISSPRRELNPRSPIIQPKCVCKINNLIEMRNEIYFRRLCLLT
jgi:hypothetical protein